MKEKLRIVVLFFLFGAIYGVFAQEKINVGVEKNSVKTATKNSPSSIFKFEPDYLTSVESERAQQKKNRAIVDTLSISDRKKRRLLKKTFKNDFDKHLSKTILADTKFTDTED